MDANEALDGLLHVSAQVREAVLLDSDGIVARGALSAERASRLAAGGQTLLERAGALRGEPPVEQVRVSLDAGDLYVLRRDRRVAVATTVPDSTRSLVVYDLRVALERWEDGPDA